MIQSLKSLAVISICYLAGGCSSAEPDDLSAADGVTGEVVQKVTSCPPGYVKECDSGGGEPVVKPFCWCEPVPPQSKSGTVIPKFYVTHVVYDVPGESSSVKYSTGTTVGSATSTTSSWKNEAEVSFEGGFNVLAGLDGKISVGASATAGKTDVAEVFVATNHAYTKPGVEDIVNHDNDEIWFIMKPRLAVTATADGPGQPPEVRWKFASDQSGAQLAYAYVAELKNPNLMPQSKKALLQSYGITATDFPELLKADPFANGAMNIDQNRFAYVGGYQFTPPLSADAPSSAFSYELNRTSTQSSTIEAETSYSVGVSATLGFDVGFLEAEVGLSNTLTFTSSSSTTDSRSLDNADSFVLGQPAYGYNGPGIIDVYVDKIWNTYMFAGRCGMVGDTRCDFSRQNLALSRPAWQIPDPGWAPASNAVDGNTDGNWYNGSVTHTDFAGEASWWVDLGSVQHISEIQLFNRTDCCESRLSEYWIYLSQDSTDGWNGSWWVPIDTRGTFIGDGDDSPRSHALDTWARWVVVSVPDDYLSLAEVKVLGF
jgi:hypothetical protein